MTGDDIQEAERVRAGTKSPDDGVSARPNLGRHEFALSALLGSAAALVGLSVIAGWIFHVRFLVQPIPGAVPMQFNTALGMLLIGLALIVAHRKSPWIFAALGAATALIGIATISQYAAGRSLGFDDLFVKAWITNGFTGPSAMAPNTAVCFLILGSALITMSLKLRGEKGYYYVALAGAIVSSLGGIALCGYIFGIETAYGWGMFTRMAPTTAFCFILLGAGIAHAAKIYGDKMAGGRVFWLASISAIAVFAGSVALWQALYVHLEDTDKSAAAIVFLAGIAMAALLGLAIRNGQITRDQKTRLALLNVALETKLAELEVTLEALRRAEGQKSIFETAKQLAEVSFLAIFRASPMGMCLYELDEADNLILIHANPAASRIFGFEVSHLTGLPMEEAFPAMKGTELLERYKSVAKTGEPLQIEETFYEDDNFAGAYDVHAFKTVARRMCIMFMDVTERRKFAVERERLIRELEAKNAELERFTYTVSHDLRSPLITIKSFVGMIGQDAEKGRIDRMQGDLGRIAAAADKMDNLLSELLELSRIGRIIGPTERIDMSALFRDVVELLDGRIRESDARVEIEDGMPDVFGDKQRIMEVAQNLIDNALKFSAETVAPLVKIGHETRDGETVFYVSDNGPGIEPQYREKVFGLFEKLSIDSAGTGVGLALVKRIVEFHGGRIWVEPPSGGGAAFYFTLPLTLQDTNFTKGTEK